MLASAQHMKMKLPFLLLAVDFVAAVPSFYNSCTLNFQGGSRLPYTFCNASASKADRIADLVSRMTYQEKCLALDSGNPSVPRLGIPSLPNSEGLHGVVSGCGAKGWVNGTGCPTDFPAPIALGATYDKALWHSVGQTIGLEARALSNQQVAGIYLFTPNINLVRDPRWGRNQEVPGESPTLVSEYAVAYITGLQQGPDPKYLMVASTAKHLSVYDMEGYMPRTDDMPRPASCTCDTPGGCERWNIDASPPARDFVGYFVAPYQAACTTAAVRSVMCSYNAVYGIPSCGNGPIQNTLLRQQWGWDGVVLSDFTAIELMMDEKYDDCKPPYPPQGQCKGDPFTGGHNYAQNVTQNAQVALAAGTDFNLGAFYRVWLYDQWLAGTITNASIDLAVSRVYGMHIDLGLLDPMEGQTYVNLPPSTVDSQANRNLALKAAREAIVLLQNNGNLLPLKNGGAGLKIAFIGPHANSSDAYNSNYHGQMPDWMTLHTPYEIALSRGLQATYSWGCHVCDVVPPGFPNMPCPNGDAKNASGIPAAAAAARAADVAIVFVGLDQTSEAENFDRSVITLPGVQEQLVEAVQAAQPQTVVVFINGGPVSSSFIKQSVPAVLEAFYPGELGADAIIDVITGAYSPAGKLPYTVYYPNITQRDIRDVNLTSAGGITYQYFLGPVLYPFGFGLSYSQFHTTLRVKGLSAGTWLAFDIAEFIADNIDLGLPLLAAAKNVGSVISDCVLLAFVSSDVAGAPLRQLVEFTRKHEVQPGQSSAWGFKLFPKHLSVIDDAGRRVLMPGTYTIRLGTDGEPNAAPIVEAQITITLTGEPEVLEANEWVAEAMGVSGAAAVVGASGKV